MKIILIFILWTHHVKRQIIRERYRACQDGRSYMVVVPALLEYPSEQTACLHLSKIQGAKDLDITLLQSSDKRTDVLSKKVKESAPLQCVTFQVPAPSEGKTEEVSTFQVRIRNEGGDTVVTETTQVLIQQKKTGTFIQTDKPIYKPEDTVKFRIVTLDKNFIASNNEYPLVELQDPKGNRIGQWMNVTPRQGIVDLSFPLASEPIFGKYTISTKDAGASQNFDVEEYVLPKFEVVIHTPKVLTCLDKTIHLKVCGRYTYGKPVQGTIQAALCRKRSGEGRDLCEERRGQTDRTGCFSIEIETTSNFTFNSPGFSPTLHAQATLVEDGTGVEINTTTTLSFSPYIATVTFEDSEPYYKEGLHYRGKLKLKGADGKVLEDKKVLLKVQIDGKMIEELYTTDESGLASFFLDTSSWDGDIIQLTGEYKGEEKCDEVSLPWQSDNLRLSPFYAESKSFVKLRPLDGSPLACDQEWRVTVDYIIDGKDLEETTTNLNFFYLVMGKGKIRDHGKKQKDVSSEALKGSFSIPLPVSTDSAPSTHVLVYALFPKGRLVADGAQYKTSKCFKNKVKVSFSEDESLPGSEVDLQVAAASGSLCAVRTVDRSVLLLRPESELSISSVYGLFPKESGYPGLVDEYSCRGYLPRPRFSLGSTVPGLRPGLFHPIPFWRPYLRRTTFDTFKLFKDASLKILTSSKIKKCDQPPYFTDVVFDSPTNGRFPIRFAHPGMTERFTPIRTQTEEDIEESNTISMTSVSEPAQEEKVRQDFPESWIWELVPISSSGHLNVPVTVPDTITEWKASAYCIADIGFGLSQMATLTTFQPFFVDLTNPYSVIRGESFSPKATVFNYLKKCIMVDVKLSESSDFQLEACSGCQYISCVCANEAKTFTWNVTATKLGDVNLTVSAEAIRTDELCGDESPIVPKKGKRDILIKSLLVQPEGILEEKTHSSLLCNGASEKVSLELPPNVVEGSERAYVSVIADLMGRSLNNVEKLLVMPSGCGEQNMVKFAPISDILEYLGNTGQLTPDIKEKAKAFMESGYQRELNYKHKDGSYSAFGENDASGSTWLTAFVAKSFGRAKDEIFIDEKYITEAVNWLKSKQKPSGCFQSVGKLLNNALQGGVDDEISLSTYIAAALLELGTKPKNKMVQNAFQCLESSEPNATSLYTKALLAYVYTLADNEVKRSELLIQLEEQAFTSDGQTHWSQTPKQTECTMFWCQPHPADVEISAYVLLAYMSKKTVSAEDITAAMPIVRWLIRQQNAYGGFTTTQDTIVALQALAKYAEATYSTGGEMTLSVSHEGRLVRKFSMDDNNRLLLQQELLSDIPGEYNLKTSGKGCLYVQTILRCNVPPPRSYQTFLLELEVIAKECSLFRMKIDVSYVGNRVKSNMAMIEVKMPSGFIPVKETVRWLNKHPLVKKTESKHDNVIIYLEELSGRTETFIFSVEQDIPVKDLKPATVKVYDYYQPEDFAVKEYNVPCA